LEKWIFECVGGDGNIDGVFDRNKTLFSKFILKGGEVKKWQQLLFIVLSVELQKL